MAYTASQVNTLFQSILQRPADVAAIQAFAGSSASNEQIRTQIETSNEAAVNVNPIVRLYQGAFGRLPDTAGLQANVTNYTNGYNINATATAFLAGPEAAAIFGSANPTVTTSFVSTVYQNALNRTAGASETAYWVGTGKSAGQVLAEISNSQEAVNKEAVPTISFLDAQATSALNGTNTSVTGSLYNQVATNSTFTSGADTIVGSVNADTFNQAGNVTGTTTTTVTAANVQAADIVNAGSGVDTLTIDAIASAPVAPGTLNGLEIINVVGGPATPATRALDFSAANGLQLFTIRNNSTMTDTVALKAGTLFGLDNVTGGLTETVNFTGTANFGSAALANGTTVAGLAINGTGITNLNIISTGSAGNTAANNITNLTSTSDETRIEVLGDRAITIGGIGSTVTTFSAATASGNVTVNLAGTGAITANGGLGNDKFTFADSLTVADTVTGGAGTDTIAITGVDLTATTAANAAQLSALNTKVSGVEVLEFTGSTRAQIAGGTTATSFTNTEITKLLFNTADGGTTTSGDVINAAGSARTYAVGELNTGDLTLNLGANVSTVNVSLEGLSNTAAGSGANAANVGALIIAPDANAAAGTSSIVNITSTATLQATGATTIANEITTLTTNVGSTVKIVGGVDLTIGTLSQGGTVDASTFTGKLGITAGSGGNDVITLGSGGTATTGVNTGAGNDTITVTGGTNFINGGDGVDTINLGSGVDTVRLASTSADRDVVNNFSTSSDKLSFAEAATTLTTTAGSAAVVTNDTTAAGTGGGVYTLTGVTSATADVIKLQSGASLTTGANGGDLSASTNGTELLKALTNGTAADTYTGITAAATGQSVILLATQGANTYVYQATDTVSGAMGATPADGVFQAAEIQLIGTLNSASAAALTAANFTILA